LKLAATGAESNFRGAFSEKARTERLLRINFRKNQRLSKGELFLKTTSSPYDISGLREPSLGKLKGCVNSHEKLAL
jgi:hypothetical protein